VSVVAGLIRDPLGRCEPEARSTPPLNAEWLQRIYREIQRQVEDLCRAA
jgi:hypothetical protein